MYAHVYGEIINSLESQKINSSFFRGVGEQGKGKNRWVLLKICKHW